MTKKSYKTEKTMKAQKNPVPVLGASKLCSTKPNTLRTNSNPLQTSTQTAPVRSLSQSSPIPTPPRSEKMSKQNSPPLQPMPNRTSQNLPQKPTKTPLHPHLHPQHPPVRTPPHKPDIVLGKDPTNAQIISYCFALTNHAKELKKEATRPIINAVLPCETVPVKQNPSRDRSAKKKKTLEDDISRVENHITNLQRQIQANLKVTPKFNTGINTDPFLGCRKIVLNASSSARSSNASGNSHSPSRTASLQPYSSFQNDPIFNYQLYKQFKEVTDVAMKFRKTFMIYGRFPTVRRALKSRGWVEKLPRNSHENLMRLTTNELLRRMELNDCEHELCEAVIVTKMLGTRLPDFIWNNSTKGADRETFEKHQICSRMRHAAPGDFTLKYALTRCLHDFQWFWIQDEADVNFPRCYNVINQEQYKLFEDDFLLTACVSLLEFVEFRTKGELSGETGKIPLDVIDFACRHCTEFIRKKLNVDIDESDTVDADELAKKVPTPQDISDFLYCYYQIVQSGKQFELDEKHELDNYKKNASSAYRGIRKFLPQHFIDGVNNIWLLKPGNLSRGRGITIMQKLDEIQDLVKKNPKRFVIQKYVERPLLIYNTKFDIRQFFLLTCTSPLTVWMYRDCYLRFSSRQYSTRNFHPSIHLTNNAIQCQYKNEPNRDQNLPSENMWHSTTFRQYLSDNGCPNAWENLIYPGMKKNIIGTLLCCQEFLDRRNNSFELYGVDFMIAEDFKPWLIEINSGPDLSSSTSVTAKLCHQAIEDVIKVVIDHARNLQASTGRFECIYRQQVPYAPALKAGEDLFIEGKTLPAGYFYKFNNKQARLFPSFTRIIELDEHRTIQNERPVELMPYIKKRQEDLRRKFEEGIMPSKIEAKVGKTAIKKVKRSKGHKTAKYDDEKKREKAEDKRHEKMRDDKKYEELKTPTVEFKAASENKSATENKSTAENKNASGEKKKNSENQVIKELGTVLQFKLQQLNEQIIETKKKYSLKKSKVIENQQVSSESEKTDSNSTDSANHSSEFDKKKYDKDDNKDPKSNIENQIEKQDLIKSDEVLTEKLLKTTINETVKISGEILGQGSIDGENIVQAYKNYENSDQVLENNCNKTDQDATNNTNSFTQNAVDVAEKKVALKVNAKSVHAEGKSNSIEESITNNDQQVNLSADNDISKLVEKPNASVGNTFGDVLKRCYNSATQNFIDTFLHHTIDVYPPYKQQDLPLNEKQTKTIEGTNKLGINETAAIEEETSNFQVHEGNTSQNNGTVLKTTQILQNLNTILHRINKRIDDDYNEASDDNNATRKPAQDGEKVNDNNIFSEEMIDCELKSDNCQAMLNETKENTIEELIPTLKTEPIIRLETEKPCNPLKVVIHDNTAIIDTAVDKNNEDKKSTELINNDENSSLEKKNEDNKLIDISNYNASVNNETENVKLTDITITNNENQNLLRFSLQFNASNEPTNSKPPNNDDDAYENIRNKVLTDDQNWFGKKNSTPSKEKIVIAKSSTISNTISSCASSIERLKASRKGQYRSPNYVRGNGYGVITSKAKYDTDNYFKHSDNKKSRNIFDPKNWYSNPVMTQKNECEGEKKKVYKLQTQRLLNSLSMNLISCTPMPKTMNSFDFTNPVPKHHHPKHKSTLYLARNAYPKDINPSLTHAKIIKDIIKTEQTINDMKIKCFAAKLNENKSKTKTSTTKKKLNQVSSKNRNLINSEKVYVFKRHNKNVKNHAGSSEGRKKKQN